MNNIKLYFEIERKRDGVAEKATQDLFIETYRKGPVLENNNSQSFWNVRIMRQYARLLQSPVYKNKINLVTKIASKVKGNILDVGFGYGHIEEKLKMQENIHIYGVDISNYAVKRMHRKTNGHFRVGNILNIPHESGSFDCVLVLDVMEHIPPNKTFLAYKELYRVLKKGGHLVTSVPINEGLERQLLKGKNPGAHLREYTPNIVKFEHEISKFKVIEEHFLYAFQKHYLIKKILINVLPFRLRKPNIYLIHSIKI